MYRAYEILENEISLQEPLLKQRRNETDFLKQKSSEYEQQLHYLQVGFKQYCIVNVI